MKDENKTKAQLSQDLNILREQYDRLRTQHEQIAEQLQLYREFMENIDDICFATNLDGQIVYCNNAVNRILGYTHEEFAQLTLEQRHGSQAILIADAFNDLQRSERNDEKPERIIVSRMVKKDGGTCSAKMYISLTRDKEGSPAGFSVITRDVTHRLQAEQELRRYKDFVDNAADACFETDLNGKYIFFNDALCQHSGYTREELSQSIWRQQMGSNELAREVLNTYQQVLRTGIPARVISHELKKKDGTLYSIEVAISLARDAEGNPTGWRAISRDVTHRFKMELDLQRYKEFVLKVEDACFEVGLNGCYIFFNDALCRQTGYSSQEIITGNWRRRVASEKDYKKAWEIYRQVFETGKPAKIITSALTRKDGTKFYAELSISPIRDNADKVRGFRVISRDVTDRVTLEKELQRYKDFVENANDACYEVDLNLSYLFCNEALCKRTGYLREDIIGGNLREFLELSGKDAQKIRDACFEIEKNGLLAKDLVIEWTRKDGSAFVSELSMSAALDNLNKLTGFRVISRDVTDRIRMEKEQERYRNFLENIEELCWENDLRGRLTFANQKALQQFRFGINPDLAEFGTSMEDQLQAKISYKKYVQPQNIDRYRKMYKEVYNSGKTKIFYNLPITVSDGQKHYQDMTISLMHDSEGHPTGFRTISHDVTDRYKTERDRERYRTFLDNIDEICYECDLNGALTFANQKFLDLFGVTREQVQYKKINYRNVFPESTSERIYGIFSSIYNSGTPAVFYNVEVPGHKKIYADFAISLIRNEGDEPQGFRIIARDVTKRKKMEEEHESLKAHLAQSEKLEAIGTLAGGIAHDFNNLLMGIQGYTSLILMDVNAQDPHYESLKAIESQVKSGADLTKQLLGYARGGRYEAKLTDFNDLLKKTAAMFGRTKKDIKIHEKYAEDLWSVEVDQGQLEQVLLNLFVNSFQAMPTGGSIYLETRNETVDEKYALFHEAVPGSYIKISVTDTGVGMDEKTKQRIFEPFFTTKDMGRGAGLGLASAYGIIRGHKGIIDCYSRKGHGSTFNIYLPAKADQVSDNDRKESLLCQAKFTILLVDDEKTITDVTGAMLGKLGHEVIIAQSGNEAVVSYRMHRDKIDLVIMDMIMPEMSGGDAIERIRSINPDVRILLSSGYSSSGMAREIMDRGGVQAFIQKPFQVSQLVQKINEIMGAEASSSV